jgi:hypothetical protein
MTTLQLLSTSTRRERPSPATAQYEMLANLQDALPVHTAGALLESAEKKRKAS